MADDGNKNDKRPGSQSELIDKNRKWWLKFVPNSERWSDVNISRFLSIYRTHPLLWDPTHSFYKDQSKRMRAYSLIAGRLNLRGIGKGECIKLLKSLKGLHTEEKKKEIIARSGCSSKYTSSPVWYPQFEEIVEIVQQKLANLIMKDSLSIEAESPKPGKACCPRLYTEDIWTPEHFKTNVMNWFLTSEDEQLVCTCEQVAETNFDNICSTETSSTFYGDSISDSSSENYRCPANTEKHSTEMCSFNTQVFKSPDRSRTSIKNNRKMQRCNDRKLRKEEDMSSFCRNCFVKGTTIIENDENRPSANITEHDAEILSCCPEVMSRKVEDLHIEEVSAERTCCGETDNDSGMSKTDKKCRTKKSRNNQKRKLVPRKDSEKRLTVCEEEHDVVDACPRKSVDEESRDEIELCSKKDSMRSENRKLLRALLQACSVKYDEESSRLLTSYDAEILCPCEHKELPIFCTTQVTTCGNRGSFVSSKSESSDATKSFDMCLSTSDKISGSSSHSSSPLSKCRSFSEKEESDHRLDFQPDPTLCEKCAVDRVPVRETHKNMAHIEDPRMAELDKYCRYKDWDAIYNIRTRVQDEEPIFLIDEDLLLMIRCKDEPLRPRRENYLPTEADTNLFMDPNSSIGRQVSLNNEYKRENGLNIQINHPKHYPCEVFETPSHKPAQLIL